MHWLKIKWCYVKAWLYVIFGRSYVAKVCGHKTKLLTRVNVFGQTVFLSLNKKKEIRYCASCHAKAVIKCAWCGEPILPDEPITLYTPKKDFKVPEYAVVYNQEPLQLVGCLGWECCSGIDRAGFWVMPGKVQRVLSPMEMILMGDGETPVICNDLADPSQAIPMDE